MRISDLIETAGVGLIVPGINMPKGMHQDEISRQAKKFGNIVDPQGYPPVTKTNGLDAVQLTPNVSRSKNKKQTINEDRMHQLIEQAVKSLCVQGLDETQSLVIIEQMLSDDLRKWFRQKWVRFGPDGKIRGPCARGSQREGKPKCLPQKKAHALGQKDRAKAARRKRREDPNPNRRGKAKNVATTESVDPKSIPTLDTVKMLMTSILEVAQNEYDKWDESDLDTYAGGGICHLIADAICRVLDHEGVECGSVSCSHETHVYVIARLRDGVYSIDIPYRVYETGGGWTWSKLPNVRFMPDHVVFYKVSGDPNDFEKHIEAYESMVNEKKDACYHKVKRRYKVWPSAYASGALVRCRKVGAKNWGRSKK